MTATPITSLLGIMLGGGCGALVRYGLVLCVTGLGGQSWTGILLANCLGCGAMGVLLASIQRAVMPTWWSPSVESGVVIGFLGALTTFSTFAGDLFKFLQHGQLLLLLTYGALSVLGGLGCLAIGYRLANSMS